MNKNQEAIYDAKKLGAGKVTVLGLQHMFARLEKSYYYGYNIYNLTKERKFSLCIMEMKM